MLSLKTITVDLYTVGFDFRLYDGTDLKLFNLVGWDWSFLSVAWCLALQGSTGVFLLLRIFDSRDLKLPNNIVSVCPRF